MQSELSDVALTILGQQAQSVKPKSQPAAACSACPSAVAANGGRGRKAKLLAGFEPVQLAAWGLKGREDGTCAQGRSSSARSGEALAGEPHGKAKAN